MSSNFRENFTIHKTRFLTKIIDMGNASKWCYLLYFRLAHYYYVYLIHVQLNVNITKPVPNCCFDQHFP